MSTRAIRTSTQQEACDVCGRTLLRGERAEIYLAGGDRRSVCELCTSRALHGGWVREGEVPAYDESSERVARRRSLLRRRRVRRESAEPTPELPSLGLGPDPALDGEEPAPEWPDPPARAERSERAERPERRPRRSRLTPPTPAFRAPAREPRHVRAVPTSVEHKIADAVELFNGSEHPKTISGVARSLGMPDVSVHPTDPVGSVVRIVASWELCWYRYEVDLGEDVPSVQGNGQGYELSELSELELTVNAAADERGRLGLG